MKIVALSDLHGFLPDHIPACDLLLLAGDLCPIENHAHDFQAEWLDTAFRRWLQRLPARQVIGIAGNHDLIFEQAPELLPAGLPWHYLQDSGTTWQDIKIWGTPWQPWFFDWAFNGTPERLQAIWSRIPDDTDLLIVHGPPRGYGDGVPSRHGIRSTGCPHLLERIIDVAPRLVVFGHIHEGRGQWTVGRSTLANVTILNEEYEPVHAPWSFEW
ncbi:MAG: metallophosphoesterase [Gemmataceae bacterium]|nr:metallophosphoesterase [Gemmataceae bacterium]